MKLPTYISCDVRRYIHASWYFTTIITIFLIFNNDVHRCMYAKNILFAVEKNDKVAIIFIFGSYINLSSSYAYFWYGN